MFKDPFTIWIQLCLGAALAGLFACRAPAASAEKQILLTIEPSKENPRNSEGDIIELKDGRLCLIYTRFTGGGGDDAAADLAMRISPDRGQSWSDDKIVVRRVGGLNVMSVSLLRLNTGPIALFYLRKTSQEDCRPLMCLSTDEAQTWSEPTICITDEVGYYVLNNDRAVQLHSGRLILPVAWHQGPGRKRDTAGVIMCYLSDDNGRTWRRSKDSFQGYAPGGQRITVQEPGVVELKDGRLGLPNAMNRVGGPLDDVHLDQRRQPVCLPLCGWRRDVVEGRAVGPGLASESRHHQASPLDGRSAVCLERPFRSSFVSRRAPHAAMPGDQQG